VRFENGGGYRRECACGLKYYNVTEGWSWEDGELEELRKDPKSVELDHSVSTFDWAGKDYVIDCPCHEKDESLNRMVAFLVDQWEWVLSVCLRIHCKIDEQAGEELSARWMSLMLETGASYEMAKTVAGDIRKERERRVLLLAEVRDEQG
jgi:hypothetical protein